VAPGEKEINKQTQEKARQQRSFKVHRMPSQLLASWKQTSTSQKSSSIQGRIDNVFRKGGKKNRQPKLQSIKTGEKGTKGFPSIRILPVQQRRGRKSVFPHKGGEGKKKERQIHLPPKNKNPTLSAGEKAGREKNRRLERQWKKKGRSH